MCPSYIRQCGTVAGRATARRRGPPPRVLHARHQSPSNRTTNICLAHVRQKAVAHTMARNVRGEHLQAGRRPSGGRRWPRTPLDGRPPRSCAKKGAMHMAGPVSLPFRDARSCTVLRAAGGLGCRRSARPAVPAIGARTPRWMGALPGTRRPGRPPRSRPRALDAARAGASAPDCLFVVHLSMGQRAWQTQEATTAQGIFAIKALFLTLYPP